MAARGGAEPLFTQGKKERSKRRKANQKQQSIGE